MRIEEMINNIKLNQFTEEDFNELISYFMEKDTITDFDIDLLYTFYHKVVYILNFHKIRDIHLITEKYLSLVDNHENTWELYAIELVYFYFMDSPSEVMKYANKLLTLKASFGKASAYCYVMMIFARLKMFKEATPYMDEADIFVKNNELTPSQLFHIWINELDIFAASEQPKRYIANKDKLDELMIELKKTKYYDDALLFYKIHDLYGKVMLKNQFSINKDNLFKNFKEALNDLRSRKEISENYGTLFIPLFDYFKDNFSKEDYIDNIHSLLSYRMSINERLKIYEYLVETVNVDQLEFQYIHQEYIKALSSYYSISKLNKATEVKTEILNFSMEQKLDVISAKYHYDTLTGCYNRVFLSEIEEKELETGDIIIYLDLNDFKKINDTYGHDVGDKQLKIFAEILLRHFENDLVLRLGGDEFVVITRGLPEDVLQRLDEARAEYLTHNLLKNRYGFSAGVLIPHGMALHEAIGEADKCMYDSKNTGLPVVIKEI